MKMMLTYVAIVLMPLWLVLLILGMGYSLQGGCEIVMRPCLVDFLEGKPYPRHEVLCLTCDLIRMDLANDAGRKL